MSAWFSEEIADSRQLCGLLAQPKCLDLCSPLFPERRFLTQGLGQALSDLKARPKVGLWFRFKPRKEKSYVRGLREPLSPTALGKSHVCRTYALCFLKAMGNKLALRDRLCDDILLVGGLQSAAGVSSLPTSGHFPQGSLSNLGLLGLRKCLRLCPAQNASTASALKFCF